MSIVAQWFNAYANILRHMSHANEPVLASVALSADGHNVQWSIVAYGASQVK